MGFILKMSNISENCGGLDYSASRSEIYDNCCDLRLDTELQTAQILYTCSFILLMLRIMNLYLISPQLGPKIIMIQHMLKGRLL